MHGPNKPFLILKNKQLFIFSKGISALDKNAGMCSQGAMLSIQSGVTALCRKYWQYAALFFEFELPGSGVTARC
jgi:hypothetical protein